MNDDFADTLVIPAVEEVQALMTKGFDGAIVWGDGGPTDVRLQLEDYWGQINGQLATDMAEHWVAELLRDKQITRWVFVTPVSYDAPEDGPFQAGHMNALEPKLVWALCFEEGQGYDLCARFFVQRPNGDCTFDQDITLLAGEQQMLSGAPGFTVMQDMIT